MRSAGRQFDAGLAMLVGKTLNVFGRGVDQQKIPRMFGAAGTQESIIEFCRFRRLIDVCDASYGHGAL